MSGEQHDPATPPAGRSFGTDPETYDRGRPGYPADAATWLTSDRPCAVLELGAGTGKLTRELVALGHEVDATDPDAAMLAILQRELSGVQTAVSTAEEIPAPDRSYDVVVAAQAAHWFDLERALPEIARVLRPGGRLSLVWNERDERIPWVRRLGALMAGSHARPTQLRDPTQAIEDSDLFDSVETSSHRFWQLVDRSTIQDLVVSRSYVTGLGEAERAARRADVLAFYDDYGRGMDGMQLPYTAQCFRATLRRQVRLTAPGSGPGTGEPADRSIDQPGRATPDDRAQDEERGPDDTMPRGLRGKHRLGGPNGDVDGDGSGDGSGDGGPDDDQVLLIDLR